MALENKGRVDSPLTPFRTITSYTEAPGSYSKHPNIGPAGEDGGCPLKFTDESITVGKPEGPSMEATEATRTGPGRTD